MSLPRYPAYQDSKLEWAKTLPEHWRTKRLKRNVRLLTEKTDTRECPVGLENLEGWTGRFIQTESDFQGEGVGFEANDILFGKLRPYLAKAWLADRTGEAIGDFHVLRPLESVIPRFIQYQLLTREVIYLVDGSTYGAKMPRASWGFLGCIELPTPPAEEQLAIATFLDRETAKIDALIAEQQRLIELLQEKRKAVISHAVTKGLNPNAPMKDSGVEWLGEVPEHWDIKSLKYLVRMKSGDFITSDSIEPEGAYPVFGGNGLRGFTNGFNREGSYVLIGRQGALCGNINTASGKFWASEHAIVCIHQSETCLGWLCKMLEASNLNQYSTSAAQPGLSVEVIGKTKVPCPPPSEQIAIAASLDQELSKMDATIETANHLVAVLGERRSALISAAVTGQIDVRGLVEEEAVAK